MRRIRQFLAIAWLTALEALREPLCLLLTSLSVLFAGALPFLITHNLEASERLVRDSAFALYFMTGLLLAAYSAGRTLHREVQLGTVAMVLSKPIDPGFFFLAKATGILGLMGAYGVTGTIAVLLSAKAAKPWFDTDWWGNTPLFVAILAAYLLAAVTNYRRRRPFVSNAYGFMLLCLIPALLIGGSRDPAAGWLAPWEVLDLAILPAATLIAFALMVLASLCLLLATRLPVVPTLSIATLVFLLGLMSDYFFGRHADANPAAALAFALTPNWQHFWRVDALAYPDGLAWAYVGRAAVYAAGMMAVFLGLGTVSFRHTEIQG